MDARAEAEKRYPALNADDEMLTYPREALRSGKRGAFVAGAAWALREAEERINGFDGMEYWDPRDLDEAKAFLSRLLRRNEATP